MIYQTLLVVAAAAAATYFYFGIPKKRHPLLNRQSVEIGPSNLNVKVVGESRSRRTAELPNDNILSIPQAGDVTTLYEIFEQAVRKFGSSPFLGTRTIKADKSAGPFVFKTYTEINKRVVNLASGLVVLGAQPNDTIGIYSKNREEWTVSEEACYRQSLVIVSFYDSLGEDAVEFIALHAETKIVIAGKENLPKLINTIEQIHKKQGEFIRVVIQIESDVDEEQRTKLQKFGVNLQSFQQVEKLGSDSPAAIVAPKPEQLASIMYTSGTTGDPKGVMLTHANLVAALAGSENRLQNLLGPGDKYLSYLPMAHIFERAVVTAVIYKGGAVGFFQGDVRKLVDDILELQPTLLTGVPRVFDRIYDRVRATIDASSPLKKFLFNTAYAAKKASLQNGTTTPFWDMLVFNKLKLRLGGKVKAICSGSAPLTPTVHEFLRVCFDCPVLQGYGLTETCAGATLAMLEDPSVGHCGTLLWCCEVKLVDVPEMEYLSSQTPPRGEVAIRGPHVSAGYYKDEKKTAEEFRNGWFYSGDIGQWNENGTLSIIDRKKNIFKLSQGEYIAAEKLEGVFKQSKFVAQIWVYGESTKPTLIAFIAPEPDHVAQWAQQNGVTLGDRSTYVNNKQLVAAVLKDITDVGKAAKLRGFEFVKGIKLLPEDFSVENDLLTPTFKLKRPQLKKKFKDDIEQLYANQSE